MRNKIIAILLAVVTIFTMVAPISAADSEAKFYNDEAERIIKAADGADVTRLKSDYPVGDKPYTVNVYSLVPGADPAEDGRRLVGAKYRLFKIGSMAASGQVNEDTSKPVEVGTEIEITGDNASFTIPNNANFGPGRYRLVQTKRPDGYMYGMGTSESDKTTKLSYADFDFPLMDTKTGKVKADQTLNIYPKYQEPKVMVGFTKLSGEDATTPIEGIKFEIKVIEVHKNADAETKAQVGKILDTVTTGADGKAIFTKPLVEGKYQLIETPDAKSGVDAATFDFEVKNKLGTIGSDEADFEATINFKKDNGEVEAFVISTPGLEAPNGDLQVLNYAAPRPTPDRTPENPGEEPKKPGHFQKSIMVNNKRELKSNVSREDVVEYKVEAKLPTDIKNYKYYKVIDELDSRFTLADGLKDKIEAALGEKGTVEITGNKIVVTVAIDKVSNVDTITFPVEVKVNDTANHNDEIANDIKVNYDKGNGDKTIPTPEELQPKVKVSNVGLDVTAVEASDQSVKIANPVGATYEVIQTYDKDGNALTKEKNLGEIKVEDGKTVASLPNLGLGRYKIVAKAAPNGYFLNTVPVEFEVRKDNADGKVEVNYPFAKTELEQKEFFPTTGTSGKVPYIAGGLSMLLACAFVVLSKRKRA